MPECRNSNNIPNLDDCQQDPEWLTKDFFQKKLRIYFKDPSLEVISMNLTPAIPKGENYASVMTRVSVEYIMEGDHESRNGSYIVKSSFEGDDFSTELMKPYDVFYKEMKIYQKIIPKLNALLKEIGDTDKMFPETIAVEFDRCAIVFEDLSKLNFAMCDRTKGLDMEHAKLCLKKLAKMHATSAVLNEREPGISKDFDRGLFNRHTNNYSPLFVGLLEACGKLVSQWDDFKEYGEKMLALKPKLMEYGNQVFDPIDGHLNVLTHGDFWINNAMFNEGPNEHPIDVILLDFQYSCWGSPAIDLHYFFNTSLREEIRLHQQDELFQYYYNVFAGTLKALRFKAKIPSLHQFLLHMIEKSFFAFVSGCLIQAIHLTEQTDDADFHALMGEDERAQNFKSIVFQNEKVQKNLKRLLPMFDRKGLLDHRD
ncbi:uncharacterized protein LOC129918566 [Episyrphus balteatus]|uniref:uncharacterized protein LOC129918566 n=1 Tax=Episyrphus balteatus TaxID=286459 RepID=UPI00248609C5|nr:uncharacterized protein LOC129918566 [Episyrphus balteatus]